MLRIETAQNVGIDQPVASATQRIFGGLLDGLVILVYLIVALFVAGGLELFDSFALLSLLGLPILLYHLICEIVFDGQSFGKMAAKTRVVSMDGGQATVGQYAIRWLLRLVEVTLTSGSLALWAIVLNGRGQRLGDIAAGTAVVRVDADPKLADTLTVTPPADHEIQYPSVRLLSDADMRLVADVIDAAYRAGRTPRMSALVRETADGVATRIGIEPSGSAMAFLKAVRTDYAAVFSGGGVEERTSGGMEEKLGG